MENLKLVHIITTIDRGGAELAVLELAKAQAQKGYDVTLIPLKGDLQLLQECLANQIKVDTAISSSSFLRQVLYVRTHYLDEWILHAHLPRAEMLARLSFKSRHFFLTRHNQEQFFPKGLPRLSRLLSRFVTKPARGVISISKAVESFLLSSGEILEKTPHRVIYYGYKPRMAKKEQKMISLSRDTRLRIGTIGRLVPQKNISFLLDFANLLKRKQVNFRVQIVGDGPDYEKLMRRVSEDNLNEEVQFLGRIGDVDTFLKSQDLFLFTSRYEGFGLALLEAMDVGLPIIAPNISAMPEVIGEDHPGLYESEDLKSLYKVFSEFLASGSARSKALQAQQRQLKQFNTKDYFEKHHDFYQ